MVKQSQPIQLKVECVNPPIPLRSFDYSVTKESYDEGDHIAYGTTPEEALQSYLDWFADENGLEIEEIRYTIS